MVSHKPWYSDTHTHTHRERERESREREREQRERERAERVLFIQLIFQLMIMKGGDEKHTRHAKGRGTNPILLDTE